MEPNPYLVAVIAGLIVSAVSSAFNWVLIQPIKRANDRQDRAHDELRMQVKELEEKRIAAIEKDLSWAKQGRKEIHDRLNLEMVNRNEFNSRHDALMNSISRMEKSVETAVLDARESIRKSENLTGKIEMLITKLHQE